MHIMWVVLDRGVCPADMVNWTDVGLVLVRRLRILSGIDLACALCHPTRYVAHCTATHFIHYVSNSW